MSGRPQTAEECVKGQDAARKALDRCDAAGATWAECAAAMIRAMEANVCRCRFAVVGNRITDSPTPVTPDMGG